MTKEPSPPPPDAHEPSPPPPPPPRRGQRQPGIPIHQADYATYIEGCRLTSRFGRNLQGDGSPNARRAREARDG